MDEFHQLAFMVGLLRHQPHLQFQPDGRAPEPVAVLHAEPQAVALDCDPRRVEPLGERVRQPALRSQVFDEERVDVVACWPCTAVGR